MLNCGSGFCWSSASGAGLQFWEAQNGHSDGGLTDKGVCSTRCLRPPFSEQLKGVYVGLAVASASLPLRTLRDLDPSTFPLLKRTETRGAN